MCNFTGANFGWARAEPDQPLYESEIGRFIVCLKKKKNKLSDQIIIPEFLFSYSLVFKYQMIHLCRCSNRYFIFRIV